MVKQMTKIVKKGSEELQIKYSDIIDALCKLARDLMDHRDL
jgi:hypothetical protein